ncbi:MAG: N-acetylmuramoyl-L-alanine amidase [Verrucomicrobiota bacterium]|nr:N-acetylmuramoyl-L-alanine amidase [Verrucomicrobiota bacterium]
MTRPILAPSKKNYPPLRRLANFLLLSLALAFSAGEVRAQSRTIVVDAGHGGHDRGGVPRQRVGEKGLTLDVSQRLRRVLEAGGYRVIMTRNSDVFVSLGQRVAIANSHPGATFVSVHFNSAPRVGANGIETYYYRRDSASLAANIHRNVVAGAPSENRGIRRRGYYVLRRTRIPGVLVECGFLTNPMEARYALNPSYRQKLAEEIARGIRGVRAPMGRPLARGSASSSEVLPQPFSGPDFVRATPRSRRSARSSKSKKKKKSSSSKRKRSSSGKKKKSSSVQTVQILGA